MGKRKVHLPALFAVGAVVLAPFVLLTYGLYCVVSDNPISFDNFLGIVFGVTCAVGIGVALLHVFKLPERKPAKRRGMSEKRLKRAETEKRIKDQRPELSYEGVAIQAALELDEEVTHDDVRNDYREMGWTFELSNRIR